MTIKEHDHKWVPNCKLLRVEDLNSLGFSTCLCLRIISNCGEDGCEALMILPDIGCKVSDDFPLEKIEVGCGGAYLLDGGSLD